MPLKFHRVKVGDVLYQRGRANDAMRTKSEWSVKVLGLDIQGRRARVSWNGNAPSWMYKNEIECCYRTRMVRK